MQGGAPGVTALLLLDLGAGLVDLAHVEQLEQQSHGQLLQALPA